MPETAVECVEAVTVAPKVSTGVDGLRWYWLLLAFFSAAALVVIRDPSVLLNPQFFAEDGRAFFADAFNRGAFASLVKTQSGYFQTAPRLAAALATIFPLAFSPLIMNLFGLAIQVLPVPLLLSSRLSVLGSRQFRVALALMYVGLPNCREVNVSATQTQWHLPIAAFLLLIASIPRSTLAKAFDLAVYILCGLTGPFCLFLLPASWILARMTNKEPWRWYAVAILGCCSVIQGAALLLVSPSTRDTSYRLGASLEGLTRIIAGQIYLGTLLGHNSLAAQLSLLPLSIVAILGSALVLFCLVRAGVELRVFFLTAALAFIASLLSPAVAPPRGDTAWHVLQQSDGLRYWFLPTVGFSGMLVWFALGPKRTSATQSVSILLLLVMSFGVIRDWRYPPYPDFRFRQSAAAYDQVARGTKFVFPEVPAGWYVTLTKR